MNEKIKMLRKELNLTQEEFSTKIGLSRNFIAQIETGTKKPSDRTISDICREFNVNEEWLRTGSGEMFKKRSKSQEIGYFANDIMDLPDENFKKRFISALTKLDEKDWAVLMKIADELNKEG